MGDDADRGADIVHFLIGFTLDRNVGNWEVEDRGDVGADCIDVRAEAWFFADQSGVDVGDGESGGGDLGSNRSEQGGRVCAEPFRVGVGKMRTDVAEGGGAEEGIDDGVKEDICIGVAGEAGGVRDQDSAEKERAGKIEAVGIVAVADAEAHSKEIGEVKLCAKGRPSWRL